MFKSIDASDKERVFAIGDIHGRYDLLMEFIKWSKLGDKDLLVSVGDLIDRGEQNLEVLTHFLFADNCDAVMGNHDQLMFQSLVENNREADLTWICNGGDWALKENLNFLKGLALHVGQLPVFLDIKFGDIQIGVTHAEFPFPSREKMLDAREVNFHVRNSVVDDEILEHMIDLAKVEKLALWGRRQVKNKTGSPILGYDFVIHGHTPTQTQIDEPVPIQKANQHWIDTGSCFGDGRQTIMEIKKDGTFQYHQFWFDEHGELCIV
ncbi:NinI-like serine-threonine phosphatase [Vibrio phage D249]|nr:putative serine/threonine-protein phosphatase 1 [Vibrio phage 70E38.1]QZI88028.1 serine/threonine protein phosphatase [Vibrio phage 234P1]QZI88202.1 putative serine/threonine-protein phosphatase 1 [Vibrio phage 234P7B]QZI88332.1 putative serine/threonine-protein phosphatase 1 [Vibrio phage 294E48.1]QZI88568.1 putative serine/threonine-protein phosphatase 1 [Vibrio phage 70E35.2]QZI88752.1 putative serine/threonine-protein phosphatase 1 [Vibrio phage 70E35.5a]QZI88935.1 putative serine/thre